MLKLKRMLDSAKSAIFSAEEILKDLVGGDFSAQVDYGVSGKKMSVSEDGDRIIEGVFNGEKMIGPDDKEYPIPANYASKSKLVPGDVLKLTIAADGKLMYKQIGPAERKSVIGTLVKDGNQYGVLVDDKMYKVLLASVTYYHASLGDQITLMIPADSESEWGAIEAVLPQA